MAAPYPHPALLLQEGSRGDEGLSLQGAADLCQRIKHDPVSNTCFAPSTRNHISIRESLSAITFDQKKKNTNVHQSIFEWQKTKEIEES